jgi:ribosomal protein S18 acetylase RimI-like enzyme
MSSAPEDFIIRPFVEGDAGDVVALWRVVFAKDPPWNEPSGIIRRKLRIQRDLFLVGAIGREIVATAIAGYDGFRGWVYHVAVAPENRRTGIGRAMMAEVETRLRAHGCPKINLQVRAANADVVEFYKRLGYTIEEHTSMGKLLE